MLSKNNFASIQKHIQIKEIKDDVVILKNKELRAILMATSLNFDLKSTEEQDAIIYKYQEFLNSIDFPIQIMIASRKFDIDPYIQTLNEKQVNQENELLKIQALEYVDFIKGLTEITNIMTESFYIVIPYSPFITQNMGIFKRFFKTKKNTNTKELEFNELKNNLWQRVEFVATGLRGMGIKTAPLNTEELVELFYKLYNPNAKEEPELQKAKELRNQ
ncbi:hypothetical protein KKH96_02370 [Patescibacteria group bacterium]|nr:hypothetical protein [Patescibacteria group bacterium]